MGFRVFLIGFPVLVMIVSIILGGGNLQSNSSNNYSNGFSCVGQDANCVPAGTSTVITCLSATSNAIPGQLCKIFNTCLPNPPAPAWCFPFPFNLSPADQGTFLWSGASVVLTSSQENQGLSTGTATYNFGDIGVTGFILIITVIVAVAVLASIKVFGSGISDEAVHVLFIAGGALGLWGFLTLFDGFISGSKTSMFAYLNTISAGGSNPAAFGFGTVFYVLLTLLYTVGVIGLVSRGE